MAAVSAVKLAIKAKIYRNTGTFASPTWVAINNVRDANMGAAWDKGDAAVRATRVKIYAPTQVDLAANCVVRCDDADAGYGALDDASISSATLDLLILDGPITVEGTRGWRGAFHISNTGQDQSIGSVLYKNFDIFPGFSTDGYPKSIIVGAASSISAASDFGG
jgi:hypothetical protein